MENSVEGLKRLKTELLSDPTTPLLGIYLKETKVLSQKDTHTPMFIAAYFTIAKTWKNLSVHKQMNEQRKCDVYSITHLYSTINLSYPLHTS